MNLWRAWSEIDGDFCETHAFRAQKKRLQGAIKILAIACPTVYYEWWAH